MGFISLFIISFVIGLCFLTTALFVGGIYTNSRLPDMTVKKAAGEALVSTVGFFFVPLYLLAEKILGS